MNEKDGDMRKKRNDRHPNRKKPHSWNEESDEAERKLKTYKEFNRREENAERKENGKESETERANDEVGRGRGDSDGGYFTC
jgi:hypothetical protein